MTTLLVTTTHRESPADSPSGYVYTFDLERQQVTQRTPIINPPWLGVDPNPRGGLRGAKGIACRQESLFLANYGAVFHFNRDWQLLGVIQHPSCAGIHDIIIHHDSLWVTSSRNDLLFEFDFSGNLRRFINLRTLEPLRRLLRRRHPNRLTNLQIRSGAIDFHDPRSHRYTHYDGLHVNSLGFLPDGSMLIQLGMIFSSTRSVLLPLQAWLRRAGFWDPLISVNRLLRRQLRLSPQPHTEILVHLDTGRAALLQLGPQGHCSIPLVLSHVQVPLHSLSVQDDGTLYFNDTSSSDVVHFDLCQRQTLARIPVPGKFLRGFLRLDNTRAVVGTQNSLCVVNLREKQVLGRAEISKNISEAIYDIKVLPPGFAALPDRLENGK
jgi:hypothetical protein